MAVISFHDVTVSHGPVQALQISDLSLEPGTLVGLIGPNGSGKTTLLTLIAGLQAPSQGQVQWPTGNPGVAVVGQRHDQSRWMPLSAGEVLAIERLRGKGLFKRITTDDRQQLASAADRLEIADLLDRRFGALSFGQRQRVLIASALASEAGVLLLDEPITGLDLPSQQVILDAVTATRDDGRLVVLSTHHLDEARRCDRVLVLANAVIADGAPHHALRPEALSTAFHGRVLTLDGKPILLDDHGHDHPHGAPHEHG